MTGQTPHVCVIIAAWCAAQSLPKAVSSALAQNGVTVEVIIVDDASPDDTFDCARKLARDPRVRALRQLTNAGPAAARNCALQHTRAPWIAVLDADDFMHPDRLFKLVTLAQRVKAEVVLGNLTELSDPTAQMSAGIVSGPPFLAKPDHPVQWDMAAYIHGNLESGDHRTFGYLKPLISNAFILRHGIRYNEALRNGEDFHLILSCFAAQAQVWFSPDPDYIYVRHQASVSHRANPAHMKALGEADRVFAAALSDPDTKNLMDRRIRQIEQLVVAEAAMAALRDRHPVKAFAALCRHPAAVPRFMRQLSEAVHKRIQP